jgi:hypothetical protein
MGGSPAQGGTAKITMLLTKISASSIPLAKFFALFITFLFFGAGRASKEARPASRVD